MKKVKVELTEPHTHEGRDYPPGATFELWEDQAAWLVGLGKAKPAATDSAAANKKGG